jgi:hypothetical protein
MITFLLITYLVVTAVGSAILIHGVARAPVAFEDDLGFHPIVADREGDSVAYSGPDRRGAGRRQIRAYRRATD